MSLEENCIKDNYAVGTGLYNDLNIVLNGDEVVFFTKKDVFYKDKYPEIKEEISFNDGFILKQEGYPRLFYTVLFDMDKTYINVTVVQNKLIISKITHIKESSGISRYVEEIKLDETQLDEQILSRTEIEEIFNKDNYETMLIVDNKHNVHLINDKSDFKVGNEFVPTDEGILNEYNEIIKNYNEGPMIYEMHREFVEEYNKILISNSQEPIPLPEEKDESLELKKDITEIEDYILYKNNDELSFIFINTKDGIFNISKFNLVFFKKDCFKLTSTKVFKIEINKKTEKKKIKTK